MRKKMSIIFFCVSLIMLIAGIIANIYNYASEIYFIIALLSLECALIMLVCRKFTGIILGLLLTITVFIIVYVMTGGWKKMLIIGILGCVAEIGVYMIAKFRKSKTAHK